MSDSAAREFSTELTDPETLRWMALKSLVEANGSSMRATEELLYRVQFGRRDDRSAGEFIDEAIVRHEEIVEDLEFARAVTAELDEGTGDRGASTDD